MIPLQVLTYNQNGRVFKYRDFVLIMAERIWDAANPPSRAWDRQSDRMKERFVDLLRRDMADIRTFKPGETVPSLRRSPCASDPW